MTLLAIETSTDVCGATISINGQLVALAETQRPGVHDRMLSILVRQCLENAELTVNELDGVAVSAGPGSFTGLRIGASFVKGLCQTGSPRLLPVPTMQSIACAAEEVATVSGKRRIFTVVPSHRDLCYVQTFSLEHEDGDVCAVLDHEILLVSTEEAAQRVSSDMLVAGPGARLVDPQAISGLTRCSARFVARAAHRLTQSGPTPWADPLTFEPMYQQEFAAGT